MNRFFKIVLLIFLLVFCYTSICFADEPSDYINDGNVAVVGDSFAGNYVNFESDSGIIPFAFPVGLLANNMDVVDKCINDKSIKYVLFATGLHDYVKCTVLEDFENMIKAMAIKCKEKNKYLFFHTYMKVPEVPANRRGYTTSAYDEIFRKVANEFNNVYYIDMNDLNTIDYMQQDMMHYDINFYDTLRTRLEKIIENIKAKEFGIISPWSIIDNRNEIAVAGDNIAQDLYNNEKNNGEYNILLFANEKKMIRENENLVLQALNSTAKYVLLSIGNFDYLYQTNPVNFENTIRKFANIAVRNHKILLLHSYLKCEEMENKKYSIYEYNRRILNIVGIYDNVNFIDMRDCDNGNWFNISKKNYNKEFYDIIFKRIKDEIEYIENVGQTENNFIF